MGSKKANMLSIQKFLAPMALSIVLAFALTARIAGAEEPSKSHVLHYDQDSQKWVVLPENPDGTVKKPEGKGDDPTSFSQVGFGVSAGVYNGQVQLSPLVFSFDYANIPKVLGAGEASGGLFSRTYGHMGGAFDVNSDEAGAIFHNRLGYNLLQPTQHRAVSPFLGLEPVNLDLGGGSSSHTADPNNPETPTGARSQYLNISSMLAPGVELMNDSCKAIIAAKAGGISGAGGDAQLADPAGGVEATAVCQGFYANIDLTWAPLLDKNAGLAVLTGSVAKTLGLTSAGSIWSVGAVVDARTQAHDGAGYGPGTLFPSDQTEVRAQVTINMNWAH